MRERTAYAPAKLNLYLDVLEKRPDGYHNIKTLFEKIDLKDEIIIREKGRGVDVRVEPLGLCPSGKDNIVYRAVRALLREADVDLGLEIIIKKRIPLSSGLGGGSSDAAASLRSINELFELGLSPDRLFSIGADTGKDVPFFMLDFPFAIAGGAGELLKPLDTDCSFSHVIIKPDIAVSTAQMYARLDSYAYASRKNGIEEIASALNKKDLALLRKKYYNIFEEVLSDYAQYIEKARDLLSKAGAGPGFLSGTGPSVFCTLKDRGEAVEISKRIPKDDGIGVFVATTCRGA